MSQYIQKVSMNLPVSLLKEAVKAGGCANKTEAVVLGLHELINKKNIEALISLKGSGTLKLSQKQLSTMRNR